MHLGLSKRPFVPDVRLIVRDDSVLLLLLLLLLLSSPSSLSYAVAVEIGLGGGDEGRSAFRMLPSPLLRHAFSCVTGHDLPYRM